jgi:riboflavin biosynthesis pyrimidine reductase
MLVGQMLADGLVDELHLLAYPLTLGSGERLFVEGDAKASAAAAWGRFIGGSCERSPAGRRLGVRLAWSRIP